MIRVLSLYPKQEGKRFDNAYFVEKHLRRVEELCSPSGLVKIELDRGVMHVGSDRTPTYFAAAHLYFGTMEDLQAALRAHGPELAADIPNYTDVQPQIEVHEVVGF